MAARAQQQFTPDYAVPPGESLSEIMESLSISQAELAERTDRPKKTINEIIKGKAAITPETALQFERALGVPASFWNNLEQNYRTALARKDELIRLEKQLGWLAQFPVKEMTKRGWLRSYDKPVEQMRELLNYFGVASPKAWHAHWETIQQGASFRHGGGQGKSLSALAAWLRQGHIEARVVQEQYSPERYNADRFRLELNAIRALTNADMPGAAEEMQQRCASAGVVVALVEELPKARVCGATRWLSPDLALIQLSLYYHRDDQFWFSFFHEAGHVLLHGKRSLFIDQAKSGSRQGISSGTRAEEEEANTFAANILIPPSAWDAFVACGDFDDTAIVAFAAELDIAPGIIVGRLQRERLLPYNRGTSLFRKLEWKEAPAA